MLLNKNRTTAAVWLTGLVLVARSLWLQAQGVVALPSREYYLSLAGNTSSPLPFGYSGPFTMRYQQVYDASQFRTIANGTTNLQNYFSAITNGGWISDVYFRGAAGSGNFSGTVSNVEIHLSTTPRGPDALSRVFSDNIGPDDTLVFSGSFTVAGASMGIQPWNFDHVAFSKNFWYDPRAGNLLLDVRVYHGVLGAIGDFDAADFSGDSVSRVYAEPVSATSGTNDTTGLITCFGMAPPPTLQSYITNFGTAPRYLVLGWLTQPTTYVLQQSVSLGANAVWQMVPGTGATNVTFYEYQVPLTNGGGAAFFRLAIPGGQ